MAVPRYEWQCPRCGRQFAIKVGLEPSVCPECEAADRTASTPHATALLPASTKTEPAAQTQTTASQQSHQPVPRMAFIDAGFQRRFTPFIVRIGWVAGLLIGLAWVTTASANLFRRAWENGVATGEGLAPLAWELAQIGLTAFAALTALRLLGELLTGVVRIERILAEIHEGLRNG